MLSIMRVATGLLALLLTGAAAAQQPIIYPSKGQSPQLQQSDTAQCQAWAKQTTGVDPVVLAQQASTQPGAPGPQGERIRGAAGGAAAGAMIGAIAGDAGQGAAIGAVTGTVGGGMRQRQRQRAAAGQSQANQQQMQQQLATFNRAVGACMTGRGYTVQ